MRDLAEILYMQPLHPTILLNFQVLLHDIKHLEYSRGTRDVNG